MNSTLYSVSRLSYQTLSSGSVAHDVNTLLHTCCLPGKIIQKVLAIYLFTDLVFYMRLIDLSCSSSRTSSSIRPSSTLVQRPQQHLAGGHETWALVTFHPASLWQVRTICWPTLWSRNTHPRNYWLDFRSVCSPAPQTLNPKIFGDLPDLSYYSTIIPKISLLHQQRINLLSSLPWSLLSIFILPCGGMLLISIFSTLRTNCQLCAQDLPLLPWHLQSL